MNNPLKKILKKLARRKDYEHKYNVNRNRPSHDTEIVKQIKKQVETKEEGKTKINTIVVGERIVIKRVKNVPDPYGHQIQPYKADGKAIGPPKKVKVKKT